MIKDIRNLFWPIKEIVVTIIKGIRNIFRLKKENETIQGGILRDIRNLSEHEEYYYKPVRLGNFWSSNYIDYETNDDKSKTLSIEE